MAFLSDNRAVAVYHYAVDTPPYFSVLAVEIAPGSGVFNIYDIPDSIEGAMADNYLYAIWAQFNLGDESQEGWTNGEIYGSASTNGGLTWDFPRNLTNSPTPGCTPGNCDSDAWPSLAEIVNDTLHIFYINDKDAGSSRWYEGTRTENPVMYLRVPAWEPEVQVEMTVFPESLHIYRPDASQIRDTSFNIINSGNTYLTYEMTADSTWLLIDPYANILLPAETTVINLHIDSVDLGDTAQAQITIECNVPENPVGVIPVFVYTILIRGDANCDGKIDIADVIYLINYLFMGGPPPLSFVQGDANADQNIDIADVVYLINYLFTGGPPPPPR
ncbi:MAG: dockerin type I repeat-containing protein [Candidatus Zixiibacteriota bacterium]